MSYVTDGSLLPYPKVDKKAVTSGLERHINAANWNQVCQALDDVRTYLLAMGGGGGVSDGDKGDVTVSGSGSTWTVDNNAITTAKIANSNVTLAKIANIATSRILGRVSASSGVIEELTVAQLLTLLGTFGSSQTGLVPASGGGTANFLRADGSWIAPGAVLGGFFFYGDGYDGAVTLDGVTAVAGASLAGSTYTLQRDVYWTNATFSAGITIVTNGFRIFINGTLTVTGTGTARIGANANGQTGSPTNSLSGGRNGANAATNANGVGGGNSTSPTSWTGRCVTSSIGNGGAIASPGTVGPVNFRGGGGGGGTTNVGGQGGSTTMPAALGGGPTIHNLLGGNQGVTSYTALSNGAGGGSGGGGNAGTGGVGGGGGGYCLVCARFIVVGGSAALSIESKGAAGGNGSGTGGGGGGGGGGHAVLLYSSRSGTVTYDVSGGAGGAPGTGAAGGAGASGASYDIPGV